MNRLIPFIFLGVMIVLLVVGIIFLSYLLIIGAVVGFILFVIAWIRDRLLFKPRTRMPQKRGRTIDQ